MRIYTKHRGFTLVELMISIVLGLLVSAIAVQLFLTSQRSVTVQQAMMNLQNSALFGLGSVINSIRMANLNSSQPFINDEVLYGGVVLSPANISNNKKEDGSLDFTINDNLLTRGEIGESNLKDQKSDQLVIQYKVSTPNQFDCEGTGLTTSDYVVERYFLRKDTNRNDPNEPLALACKAARYTEATAKTNQQLNGLSGNGEIIIPRVDHFSVRLGIAYDGANNNCNAITTTTTSGTPPVTIITNIEPDTRLDCFSYMNIQDYRALTGEKPQIVSVQIGLLVRSTDTVGTNQFFDANNPYKILNKNAILNSSDRNNLYLRSVVTQTIAIRNGFGIE
ncbi:prepilin-type N-terminal cleavage/methylation domain-containing protein [Acinetobacter sp. ANC 5380]|uniref:Prepilin-type N-terminal cleavage/methylation domain-containing protein n=1 Tax=Acinetobacter terrae TaxID=2731247 RepID=A0A7Y2RGU5_9GAMM|nr:PilW family protein [Acinetobacter terrae]NNH78490.1 prepilin-type N-terminal cleavage/methylation domain-containing protein [Acinetobacter terrae]